jgi:hypothetical protein
MVFLSNKKEPTPFLGWRTPRVPGGARLPLRGPGASTASAVRSVGVPDPQEDRGHPFQGVHLSLPRSKMQP